jgi:predicted nucleic acid-binding protein
MIYVLDTNVISDRLNGHPVVTRKFFQMMQEGHVLCLSAPVEYEVRRGLLKRNATRKFQIFTEEVKPKLVNIPLTDADWKTAAQLWAQMRQQGRQFSDVDVLLAAIATRLEATLISADDDFVALSLTRSTWRTA